MVAQDLMDNMTSNVQEAFLQPAFQVDVPQARAVAVKKAVSQLQISETLQPIQSILS